jgi:hypothetical protein
MMCMTEREAIVYFKSRNTVLDVNNRPILSLKGGKRIKTCFYHSNIYMEITHLCAQERFQLGPCLKTYSAHHMGGLFKFEIIVALHC